MVIDLFVQKKRPHLADRETAEELNRLNREIKKAENIFNFVTDYGEIEAAIYNLKALEVSRQAIIRRIKLENSRIRVKL